MTQKNIKINDFKLLITSLKAFNKIAESAKLSINANGLFIYGKNAYARCELNTDAVMSADGELIEFCIADLSMFLKTLETALDVHEEDYSDLSLFLSHPFVHIESGKFKAKIGTCKEEIIVNSISQKIKTPLTPVFEFSTSTKQIKYVVQHSYILSNVEMGRIYIGIDSKMENNVVYARIGNDSNELNNSMTLKLGLATFGSIDDRKIILNFDRLSVLNVVESDNIQVQLMDKNVLASASLITGNNDTSCRLKTYVSILVN